VVDFFKFPHTPHLAWLGQGEPRDDKVLTPSEAQLFLAGEVVVEEKLDGANLGFSLAGDGRLRVQNRGQYLTEPYMGQFARLPPWLELHGDALRSALTPNIILFGEWCAARHSLEYSDLPDWLLLFDVYDRAEGRFWSTPRRNALAFTAGLATVPQVTRGKLTLAALTLLMGTFRSNYRRGGGEGLVARRESVDWCCARAKLVRADFTQAIDTHWRKRTIEWNRVGFPDVSRE
jgi:ATP-dependent RNA circularization protein (DNA/RNA ligase family)